MILEEVIQRVQSLYSKGVQSRDSRLTARHIYSAVVSARSTLLRQQKNKNQLINQWLYQTLPCVELKLAPVHECPCVPNNKCSILRSVYQLPSPITSLDNHLIQSVTTLDGSIGFDASTFDNIKYASGNKYTSTKPKYYIRNRYIYFSGFTTLKALAITGLFENPLEAKKFPSICPCTNCECEDIMKWDFPVIDGDLSRAIFQLASEELISMFKQMKEDKNSNSSDDDTGVKMIHQPR